MKLLEARERGEALKCVHIVIVDHMFFVSFKYYVFIHLKKIVFIFNVF